MYFINCEINLILTWSASCIVPTAASATSARFAKTEIKCDVPVGIVPAQDNSKLLQQAKSRLNKQ